MMMFLNMNVGNPYTLPGFGYGLSIGCAIIATGVVGKHIGLRLGAGGSKIAAKAATIFQCNSASEKLNNTNQWCIGKARKDQVCDFKIAAAFATVGLFTYTLEMVRKLSQEAL